MFVIDALHQIVDQPRGLLSLARLAGSHGLPDAPVDFGGRDAGARGNRGSPRQGGNEQRRGEHGGETEPRHASQGLEITGAFPVVNRRDFGLHKKIRE
jgi:hypothetical protein